MTGRFRCGNFEFMDTVRVDLPSALLKAANLQETNLSQEAARLLALELFREERVSLGRAAELCQTPLATFMDFAAQHGVPPLRYTAEDLEAERRLTDRIET
jgi:predicted HTH domain antitoxin